MKRRAGEGARCLGTGSAAGDDCSQMHCFDRVTDCSRFQCCVCIECVSLKQRLLQTAHLSRISMH